MDHPGVDRPETQRAQRHKRERRVLLVSLLLSVLVHAAALVLPMPAPAPEDQNLARGSEGGPVARPPVEVVHLPPPPRDRNPDEPVRARVHTPPPPARARTPGIAPPSPEPPPAPTRLRFGVQRSDPRLWRTPVTGRSPSDRPIEPWTRHAHHESAAAALDTPRDFTIGPLRLVNQSCESVLTCKLQFQRLSDMDLRFSRIREVEAQAALRAFYRKRLEAMKVRRKRRR